MTGKNLFPHVFQPLRLRGITIKNRLELTPFVPCLTDAQGGVTQDMMNFIRMQARTGAGIIVLGCITDSNRKLSEYADLETTHDRFVPGLSLLADEVHKYGARLAYELSHSGRGDLQSARDIEGAAGMTEEIPVPSLEAASCTRMTREDMDWLIQRQVDACRRVLRAGFDMIFIHAGHNAYLSSWLSPLTNHRTDEYGGSLKNRMRFPLELIRAVREAIGEQVPIELRASVADMIEGGIQEEECFRFFEAAEPYIDLAHVSRGNCFHKDGRMYTSPMYMMEHRINEEASGKLKKRLKIPVTCVGNIWNLQDAEEILAKGHADVVGFARSPLADPQLFVKAVQGRFDEVRPCLKCMDGCGRIFHGLPARCAVNPELGMETEARMTVPPRKKQRVLVLGAGPAGMQAALTLRERGHEVILAEKSGRLGGKLYDAGAVSFKWLMRDYRDYLIRMTERSGAKILLNTEGTRELVEQIKPDAVFVATGSTYLRPPIPGIDRENVHMLADVDGKGEMLGKKIVICGGGLSGVEAAVDFARQGHEVTVVDMILAERFCSNLFMFAYEALFKEVETWGVKLLGNRRILEFQEHGVAVEHEGVRQELSCEDAIIALGLRPEDRLGQQLLQEAPMSTYIIGDAGGVKNIRNATRTAYDAVLTMESGILV
ncbi:MAG: FAD-dependent oxidoreductase [Lachnospiraceae bacterium]|nr:FAD-dependent oxidoreductase [Lachnospiraceae bacterium]